MAGARLVVVLVATLGACGGAAEPGLDDNRNDVIDGIAPAAGGGGAAAGGAATGTSAATGATTNASASSTSGGGASCSAEGVMPSCGSGGPLGPGEVGPTPLGAKLRMPASYAPAEHASPVVWLFNETLEQWSAIAEQDRIVLVDLAEYNDVKAIAGKLDETVALLEAQYNVDRARYYWAGWSAGGNIAIILGSQNQALVAGTLAFPGTGGNLAKPHMQARTGHKIRLFYACGDADQNFPWTAVQGEASYWASLGYGTKFVKVAGSGHYLDEQQHGVRALGWGWIRDFNLTN